MMNIMKKWVLVLLICTLAYVGTGSAETSAGSDLPSRLILSCERQDDNRCVTRQLEQALLANNLDTENNLIVRYELAARYEYYEKDLNKARNMYLEIEKIRPNYGITKLCIARLNRQLNGDVATLNIPAQ